MEERWEAIGSPGPAASVLSLGDPRKAAAAESDHSFLVPQVPGHSFPFLLMAPVIWHFTEPAKLV